METRHMKKIQSVGRKESNALEEIVLYYSRLGILGFEQVKIIRKVEYDKDCVAGVC